MMYVSPVLTLIGICDRQPERESLSVWRSSKTMCSSFFAWFMAAARKGSEGHE